MMVSAPDTPYGAAFMHFCQVFAYRPLNLPRLQAAFATVATLAAQEAPAQPWPLTFKTGTTEQLPFTIEALLAQHRARYATRPRVPANTIQDLFPRWTGATIQEVIPGWQGAGFQLRFAKRGRLAPKKTRTASLGSLGVSCSWQLVQAHVQVCSSEDDEQHMAVCLSSLKGQKLTLLELGEDGSLRLSWRAGSWLGIQPDGWVGDYFLDFGWQG
jgi:hypothetical protein